MTNRPIVQLDIQDPVMDIGHFFNIWRGMLVNGAGIPVIHNWQVDRLLYNEPIEDCELNLPTDAQIIDFYRQLERIL